MSNTHQWIPMETWFSDGIGKILFVTPSHGSKITGSHDEKEYRKSDKYWGGQKCCPMDSIDIHSSDGIQWSPSMSIGITRSVVVNLNSDKRTDILSIAHIFPLPYVARKNTTQLANMLNVLFELFYSTSNIKVHTNLALFYLWISESQEIRYANFLWCWHGQRSLGRAYILFLYPHLRLKMLISVYIIEQFSAVT